jgi:lysophospholipase L1-like esterase
MKVISKPLVLVALLFVATLGTTTYPSEPQALQHAPALSPPAELSSQEDHQRMMRLLGIEALRPGANPNDPNAPNAVNYDESKANIYPELPDPLTTKDGMPLTTAETWWNIRRPEIVEEFDREIYGRVPTDVPPVSWQVVSTSAEKVGDDPVITKRLVGHVDNSSYPFIEVNIDLTLTTPAKASKAVPVMLEFGFNFGRGRLARPGGSGSRAGRWPGGAVPTWQQQLLAAGWGFARIIPTSIQADNGRSLTRGIIGLVNKGQPRKLDDWGALRAWAWGASRALDYFETDESVDAKQVGITGLSRYGKAALVAMAYDPRFAIGFIGSSGAGGAKLHRRNFGELVENLAGPGEYHWMAGNYLKYAGPLTAADLPVDAHELIALCAPRPVFISYGASQGPGAEGQWVDQRGSFMAAAAAGPVYRLLGKKGLGTDVFPPIETALVDGELAFRQHSGGHTTGPNWSTFLAWASRYIHAPETGTINLEATNVTRFAQPVPQANALFEAAHKMLLEKKTQGVIDVYFIGDSITRRWHSNDYPAHQKNWQANFHGWNAADFAWGGDSTQNALWRLKNGELDGVNPKVVVIMIGTNNIGKMPPQSDEFVEDVASGIQAIVDTVRKKAPDAKIVLMGITPRNDNGQTTAMPTINKINDRISGFADGKSIVYLNINRRLADEGGKLFEGMTEDGLHLSNKGYQIWADALKPLLRDCLGPPAAVDKAPPPSGIPIVSPPTEREPAKKQPAESS